MDFGAEFLSEPGLGMGLVAGSGAPVARPMAEEEPGCRRPTRDKKDSSHPVGSPPAELYNLHWFFNKCSREEARAREHRTPTVVHTSAKLNGHQNEDLDCHIGTILLP